ncbi:MAG TPA: molybdate ABC transporter permease subunit [Gammaproteobacteria bacterium]|nr:molybdate ABC transporter permease subunit [Gammaproteobacteria bacterium]
MTPIDWSEVLVLSLEVASLATAASLLPAVLVAWLLARCRFPGRTFLDALVHAPLVLPPVVVGYFLLLLFGAHGLIGRWLLESFGIRLAFTEAGAALAGAVMGFPLLVRSVRLGLDAVDRGLETAARSLGASPLDAFVTITLPLMLPGILAGLVLSFAACLGEFGATITFAANIPGETRTLTLAIYTALQTPGGEAVAARLVAVSLGLAVTALALAEWSNRRLRAWLHASC